MANLNDPRERQKFLQEQVNINRQLQKTNADNSLPTFRGDILSRLSELLENKDELEYLRMRRLLWRVTAETNQVYMRPWITHMRIAG